jgi:hypothetical protein
LEKFAHWLSTTGPSVFIQENEAWAIPTIQSLHIIGIGLIVGSVFMLSARILGFAGKDQTLAQTERRFGPWLTGALVLLLVTGGLLVVGEPVRELITFSFWLKMALVALVAVIAAFFHAGVRKAGSAATGAEVRAGKLMAVVAPLLLVGIILLGRLIAYDHLWGPLSPAARV